VVTEWQRSKDLDDKLSKLTAVVSGALTISGIVTKMVADGMSSSIIGMCAVLLMFLSMVFVFCGALVGFGVFAKAEVRVRRQPDGLPAQDPDLGNATPQPAPSNVELGSAPL
jgi:hypothetical protein